MPTSFLTAKAIKEGLRIVHLWTGLVFGAILVVLGLTGVALAWMDELDGALNPTLLHAAPPNGVLAGTPLPMTPEAVQRIYDRLVRDSAYGKPSQLMLAAHAGEVAVAWYRPAVKTTSSWRQDIARQVMVDPVTLNVTGERNYGEAGLSRPLLMPTLFHVHRYLLTGETGKFVVALTGVSALLTCLTGIVLWWPRLTARAFRHAVTVRFGGSWPAFNFQLHRAAGFFALPVLLVMAVSGIYFNMPSWVTPTVAAVSKWAPHPTAVNRSPAEAPRVPLSEVIAAAQARFPEARVGRVSVPQKASQPWEVRLRQEGEVRQGPGATRVSVDAGDASVLRVIDPVKAQGGELFFSWMYPLHTGEAFGLVGRAFISLYGLAPLMFFVTGLVVWLKIRRAKPVKSLKVASRATVIPAKAGTHSTSPQLHITSQR